MNDESVAKAPEPGRYRKRPVVVEAVRFDPEQFEALKAAGYPVAQRMIGRIDLWVEKSGAYCAIESGDYIIREPDGKGFYPCKPDIFAATYEAVNGAEAVNAEPPATPEMRNVAGDATPDGPDWSTEPGIDPRGALAKPTPALSGAGSGEQSRPATPEPAAPMPRVSPEWVANYAMPTSLHGPAVRDLALDLIDERARSTAAMDALAARREVVYVEERAKVAELEARIAELRIERDAAVNGARGLLIFDPGMKLARRTENENEELRAALARANEALRPEFLFAADMMVDDGIADWEWRWAETVKRAAGKHSGDCTKEAHTCFRCMVEDYEKRAAAMRDAVNLAQGSAAQKPEPRDAG